MLQQNEKLLREKNCHLVPQNRNIKVRTRCALSVVEDSDSCNMEKSAHVPLSLSLLAKPLLK